MKHLLVLLSCALAVHAPSGRMPAELRVVTTLPDLADVVRRIGAERVTVTSIARGRENTHNVPVKPSHLVALSRADLFVQFGLSLEATYVPGLLENCRNERIRPGAPGFVNVSDGWEPIEVPASLSRQGGDVHPGGNPHMNLDPRAGRHMAERVLAGLVAVDPQSEAGFRERHAGYLTELERAGARWATMGAQWKGRAVAVYHKEFSYLLAAYGIEAAVMIEPKPGIPPSPGDLTRAIADMKAKGVSVILTAVWSNGSTVQRIGEATGARIVELPNMVGGEPGAQTWIDMMQLVHERLARAFGTEANGDDGG